MKTTTPTTPSQKAGRALFALGAVYMFGLGWLYSWRVVAAANASGPSAYASLLGFVWALSVPVGAFVVVLGAALAARVERRVLGALIGLLALFTAWRMTGTTERLLPALFGIGGGLITLFFIGSAWNWAKARPALMGAARIGSDLRMVGAIFFVVAAWDLCGLFGIAQFVLLPELAARFAVPLGRTIDAASGVNILLVLGWAFHYFGQRLAFSGVSTAWSSSRPALEK